MAEPALQAFLAGRGPDGAGRNIETILGFDDEALERHHDHIQWLFPLPEPSVAVPGSPVLPLEAIHSMSRDMTIRHNIDRAASLMGRFYGRTTHWLAPHDHNHLRITRIVRSLRLLRGPEVARAFLDAVLARVASADAPVSSRSLAYWRDAAGTEAP